MIKKKISNYSSGDKLECQYEVLNSLIISAYYELQAVYDNPNYITWTELSDERRKLYSRHTDIISSIVDILKTEDVCKDESFQEKVCELKLCSIYSRAEKLRDIPELYNAYLENIKPEEKEYIIIQQKINQIDEQISPYEKYMNDTQSQRQKLRNAIDYLLTRREILTSSLGFHKLSEATRAKIVKERLRRYSTDKKTLLENQREVDDYREAWLKRYRIHSGKMDGLPRPPICSQKSDPTGNSLIEMEEAYEKIIELTAKKVEKAVENIEWVESRLERLNFTEKRIINLYYFSDNGKSVTWPDVAEQLNYTRDYCIQMDRKIIAKLME